MVQTITWPPPFLFKNGNSFIACRAGYNKICVREINYEVAKLGKTLTATTRNGGGCIWAIGAYS